MSAKKSPGSSSYGQILKSSSILGGTQAVVYVISLLKTKVAAVLLGPSGVGLIGLYTSATAMVAVAAGLGLNSSGVREIAEADASGDPEKLGRTVLVLRRLCWLNGLLGWAATIALAWPLSIWTFGSGEHAFDVMLLGSTVAFGVVAGGQVALLQGMRRIADLARVNLLCVFTGTIISIALYAWLGKQGIVPALIVAALGNLCINWLFSRRVSVHRYVLTWRETFESSGPLLRLGLALMWNGLLATIAALVARALIVRELGLQENGLYQAAWAISGMFSGFILAAMSADFYPRLAGVSGDNVELKRLVNEQTEVGLLLALPGILGTLVFAPVLLRLLYTTKFVPAAALLPWFLAGVFIQVISWPIGFVLLAKSHSMTFAVVETVINASQVALLFLCLHRFGLVGASMAFFATQCVHILIYFSVVSRRAHFAWTMPVFRLIGASAVFMAAGFVVNFFSTSWVRVSAGAVIVAAAGVFSLRKLLTMVDPASKIGRLIWALPFVRMFSTGGVSAS